MAAAKGFYGLFGVRDLQIPRKESTAKYVTVKDRIITPEMKATNDWKSAEASKEISELFKGGSAAQQNPKKHRTQEKIWYSRQKDSQKRVINKTHPIQVKKSKHRRNKHLPAMIQAVRDQAKLLK